MAIVMHDYSLKPMVVRGPKTICIPDHGANAVDVAPVINTRHSRAMMQLGDIALESAGKGAATAEYAEEWYRQAADGNPPQPDALFQLARLYHEVIEGQNTLIIRISS